MQKKQSAHCEPCLALKTLDRPFCADCVRIYKNKWQKRRYHEAKEQSYTLEDWSKSGEFGLPQGFWWKVVKTDACWNWQGALNRDGYARFGLNYRQIFVHRLVYEAVYGALSSEQSVDHLCKNRACVNPHHLEAVTFSENTSRAFRDKTHCKRGHLYGGENSYFYEYNGKKHRHCKPCLLLTQKQRRAEKKRKRDQAASACTG